MIELKGDYMSVGTPVPAENEANNEKIKGEGDDQPFALHKPTAYVKANPEEAEIKTAIMVGDQKVAIKQVGIKNGLNETPLIPEIVYNGLPPILYEACRQFADLRERDVFLTSALGVLSGCFTSISGEYGKDIVHPNLYMMMIAPPGSGKQVMKYARFLACASHRKYLSTNDLKINYVKRGEAVEEKDAKEPENELEAEEIRECGVLLIPGNTSAAMIYQHMKTNNGIGIICETETDTLSNSIKQDWGNYSDLLRKAFHHEPLSLSRKLNREYFEINNPRISVILTGTPSQVGSLIGSSEDGLMSRFIFYIFQGEFAWKSQKPCDACPDLSDYMKQKSELVLQLAERLEKCSTKYKLTELQYDLMDRFFQNKVAEMSSFGLQEAAGTVYRLGLIAFRISMVLSVLRSDDHTGVLREIICDDVDFDSALLLVDTFFYHALETYKLLPRNQIVIQNPGMVRFYNLLTEDEFTTAVAEELGKSNGFGSRTVRKYLNSLASQGYLTKTSHGHYQKSKMGKACD